MMLRRIREFKGSLTAQSVLVVFDPSLQSAGGDVDGGEELELGVQLRVGGGHVLVLVLAQLPLNSLVM